MIVFMNNHSFLFAGILCSTNMKRMYKMDLHDSVQIMEEIERVRMYLNELEETRARLNALNQRPEPRWQYGDDVIPGVQRNEVVEEQPAQDFIDIYNVDPDVSVTEAESDEALFYNFDEVEKTVEAFPAEPEDELTPEPQNEYSTAPQDMAEVEYSADSVAQQEECPDESQVESVLESDLQQEQTEKEIEDEMENYSAEQLREMNQTQLIKSILKRIGLYAGEVNGEDCDELNAAIASFRVEQGLPAGEMVDRQTMQKLDNYLYGYDMYLIRRGDTMQSIADRTGSTVRAIRLANPRVDPRFLRPGKRIVIPMWNDTVPTDVSYTYDLMKKNIYGFKTRFPFVEIGIIGKSVLGKNIYSIKLGKGPKKVFLNATHHGLEWLNTVLLMKFAEEYLNAYANGGKVGDLNASNLWEDFSIYLVPMVNPDGVDIVINGISENDTFYDRIQQANVSGRPVSQVWNANARGVDLNRNYDAGWEMAKAQEAALGVDDPGPTRFGGDMPVSEPETQAMVSYANNNAFDTAVSYHSQGNTIFANGKAAAPHGTFPLLNALEEGTAYTVEEVPEEMAYAGFKDWFIQEFDKPAFTIETGMGINPLDISQFGQIYDDNFNGIIELLKSM